MVSESVKQLCRWFFHAIPVIVVNIEHKCTHIGILSKTAHFSGFNEFHSEVIDVLEAPIEKEDF